MTNYVLELNAEQIEPVIVAALKDSIINHKAWEEVDVELTTALYRTLKYFTTQSQYLEILDEIDVAVSEQQKV